MTNGWLAGLGLNLLCRLRIGVSLDLARYVHVHNRSGLQIDLGSLSSNQKKYLVPVTLHCPALVLGSWLYDTYMYVAERREKKWIPAKLQESMM